jgi:hypothetical protein
LCLVGAACWFAVDPTRTLVPEQSMLAQDSSPSPSPQVNRSQITPAGS